MTHPEAISNALPMTLSTEDLVSLHYSWDYSTSRPVDVIDRLSAVPSSGMVRDPNFIVFDKEKEETRPKRSSSIGASLRRLFNKSPAKERSSSDTNGSTSDPRLQSQPTAQANVGEPLPDFLPRYNQVTLDCPQRYLPTINSIFLLKHSEKALTGILGG